MTGGLGGGGGMVARWGMQGAVPSCGVWGPYHHAGCGAIPSCGVWGPYHHAGVWGPYHHVGCGGHTIMWGVGTVPSCGVWGPYHHAGCGAIPSCGVWGPPFGVWGAMKQPAMCDHA